MQTTTNPVERQATQQQFIATAMPVSEAAWAQYHIIRRNGAVVNFEPSKIGIAMTKAFLAVNGGQGAASARVRELVDSLTHQVVAALMRSRPNGGTFHIEDIQDAVELSLMRSGEHDVARSYVLYRERRAQERSKGKAEAAPTEAPTLNVVENGVRKPLDLAKLQATIEAAGFGLGEFVDTATIQKETLKNLYDGVPVDEVYKSAILAARAMVENDPAYSKVTARLLLHTIRKEVLSEEVAQEEMNTRYATYFPQFIKRGVEGGLLNSDLARFDLPRLAAALDASRDLQFDYLGLQTLYDRYFLHLRGQRIELPQVFFMRVPSSSIKSCRRLTS
jgi:ribonucleoside-diphosphate reductase alpha chain